MPCERLCVHSRDNTRIAAWFFTADAIGPAPAVVLAHGLGEAKHCYTNAARALCTAGIHTLLVDLRGHGESGARGSTLGLREPDDIIAAVHLLRQRGDVDSRRIGVLGFSLGGTAAIQAAARCDHVHAVAVDSPFATLYDQTCSVIRRRYSLPACVFGRIAALLYRIGYGDSMHTVSAEQAACSLGRRPLLLVSGDQDQTVPSDHPHRIIAAAQCGQIQWIKNAGHSDTRDIAGPRYWHTIVNFFRSATPLNEDTKKIPPG